ncbi:MAG: hypothetical protein OEY52_02160 [Gammaproteobacteria bacterium]|nr:hypothetical protein [Gammaproteobacteria bacterium]
MNKFVILPICLLVASCGLKLVKEEKYIATDSYKHQAVEVCLKSKKFSKSSREAKCAEHAGQFIANAEKSFRVYKADEHNYRLCRSKFSRIEDSDKCFKVQQEKYYKRELISYRASLSQ